MVRKDEFLLKLRLGLSGLPVNEIEERIAFYSELIDDLIEDGRKHSARAAPACPKIAKYRLVALHKCVKLFFIYVFYHLFFLPYSMFIFQKNMPRNR